MTVRARCIVRMCAGRWVDGWVGVRAGPSAHTPSHKSWGTKYRVKNKFYRTRHQSFSRRVAVPAFACIYYYYYDSSATAETLNHCVMLLPLYYRRHRINHNHNNIIVTIHDCVASRVVRAMYLL